MLDLMKVCSVGLGVAFISLPAALFAHGLVVNPPARNAFCGLDQKPHNATSQACIDAFQDSWSGYQFMSVLTHTTGRQGGTTNNVCSFDSETWNGTATPWDTATNWPTTNIRSGDNTFTWDITWGPHWDDTEEFVYYITKPGFVFDTNRPLRWSDFEDQPFCIEKYSDSNPNSNPDVWTEKSSNLFHTRCNVPSRSGRHVIYAEWGRNQWTYERFHSCMDVIIN